MKKTSNENGGWQKTLEILRKIWFCLSEAAIAVWNFLKIVYTYVFRIRKILLSVPVAAGALFLANYCRTRMPEQVGLGLLENGRYAATISRDLAVFGPLLITFFCLVMMFCSRKTLYPWLISVFSLVVPILIMLTNMVLLPF